MAIVVIKPPNPLPLHRVNGVIPYSLFLAGSIEMGTAVDWQAMIIDKLGTSYAKKEDYYIFNPRRDNWDPTWEQSINSPKFYEQVSWELTALDSAKHIFMYFDPNTKSPISLLELGLYAQSKKLIVCCPNGFWRKGNVEIVCQRYGIDVHNELKYAIDNLLQLTKQN
jgi:hypothetical protein